METGSLLHWQAVLWNEEKAQRIGFLLPPPGMGTRLSAKRCFHTFVTESRTMNKLYYGNNLDVLRESAARKVSI